MKVIDYEKFMHSLNDSYNNAGIPANIRTKILKWVKKYSFEINPCNISDDKALLYKIRSGFGLSPIIEFDKEKI